jgi:glutathione S-transferase
MNLALYHFAGCAFCGVVHTAIDELGLEVELRDIFAQPEHQQELLEATGRTTVPCLRIESADGDVQWMHESQNIAQHLRALAAA